MEEQQVDTPSRIFVPSTEAMMKEGETRGEEFFLRRKPHTEVGMDTSRAAPEHLQPRIVSRGTGLPGELEFQRWPPSASVNFQALKG